MKKQITVSVDNFGRDYYSHTGRIGIEELVRDEQGQPLTTRPCDPDTVVATYISTSAVLVPRADTTWCNQPAGASGRYYLTVEIDLPEHLAAKEIIARNWQHSSNPAIRHKGV